MAGDRPTTRLRGLFDAAVGLPAAEREAFLAGSCGDAPELLERVRALLAAHERSEFLETPLAPPRPTTIGPYRVLERLGEGGMGEVFLAEQQQPVERQVALKVIKPGMDTRAVLRRFRREYRVLAMLDHPNIANVHDAGATADGRPWFVMELVRGPSLLRYCDERGLDVHTRIVLFMAVCRAVQHAHHKGVIHRDLKPSNILVTEHDDTPTPKVIDFGIAKATSGADGGQTLQTHLGETVGTPDYMSPEQAGAAGTRTDVDTRSDIWSLGVVLYELLVGRLPFGESLRGRDLTEARAVIRATPAARPSETPTVGTPAEGAAIAAARGTDVQGLVRATRGDLDWIVLKCLEKDRERRYGSAAELAADLQRHLDHEPVLAGPPTLSYRLRKSLRRYRRALAVAATFLLLTTSLSVWALVEKARSDESARQARAALTRARTMTSFLSETLAGANPYIAGGLDTALLQRIADDAAQRLRDGELLGEPEAECELRLVLSDVYYNLSAYDAQREILAPVLDLVRAAGRQESLLHAEALQRIARYESADQTHLALELHDRAYAMLVRLGEAEGRRLANDLLTRANLLDRLGRHREMLATVDEALALLRGKDALLRGKDAPRRELVSAVMTRSQCLRRLARFADALSDAERALALAVEHLAPDERLQILTRNELGAVLLRLRRPGDALGQFEEALAIAERVHPGPHALTASTLKQVVYAARDLRDAARCVDYARRALAMQKTLEPDGGAGVAMALLDFAIALMTAGEPAAAAEHAAAAVAMRRRLTAEPHPQLAAALIVEARCRHRADRLADALESGREAIAVWRETSDGPNVEVARTELLCGDWCFELGDAEAARAHFRAAAAEFSGVRPGPNDGAAWAIKREADALRRLERFDEAARRYDDADALARSHAEPSREQLDRIALARSGLLAARARFAEAEAVLEELLPTTFDAAAPPALRAEHVDARVQLYTRWGRPELAAEWQARR